MIRSFAPWLALILLTLSVCWVTLHAAPPHSNQHPYAIVAAVYQDSGSPGRPTFTFQGVFSDPKTGDPIDGPAEFRIGIGDGPANADPILSLTEVSPTYSDGRFTAEVQLLDQTDMIDINDPHIVVLSADGDDTPLTPRMPIRYAPYAWTAEYARNAGTAAFATQAGAADTADKLTRSSIQIPITGDNWAATPSFTPTATRRGDLVFLSGFANKGLVASTFFAELPAGFRPSTQKHFMVSFAPNTIPVAVEVQVFPDGRLRLQNNVNSGLLSFDGIIFEAAP